MLTKGDDMPLATRISKNLSRREQAERIRKLLARRRKKGLQAWVKPWRQHNEKV